MNLAIISDTASFMSHKKDEWVRSFECGHLDKDLFSVECLMYPTGFPEASKRISVTKRFTDFQKLYSNLSQTHRYTTIRTFIKSNHISSIISSGICT